MADNDDPGRPGPDKPGPDKPGSDKPRKWMSHTTKILIMVVLGVVLAAFAVDRVGVDLEEAQSETRQAQLRRIVRVLARPELTTTDIGETEVSADVAVPCGPDVSGTGTVDGAGTITVDPPCGEAGTTVTVTGEGFEAGVEGRITFVPKSEFDVNLDRGSFVADGNGDFTVEVTLPDRPSDEPQVINAVVQAPQGTWGNRVEVWEDTNENGVRDQGIIGEGGLEVVVEDLPVNAPAVGLIDAANLLTEFVTAGQPFEADSGPANGVTAIPLDEVEDRGQVRVADVTSEDGTTTITIAGPEGTDVSAWRAAIYDGEDGTLADTVALGDIVKLSPRISDTTIETIDKIIDTVLLALVATAAGLVLAIPLSFIAARNLMRDIETPVLNLGLALVAVPLGALLGIVALRAVRAAVGGLPTSAWVSAVAAVALGLVSWFGMRAVFARFREGSVARVGALTVVGVVAVAALDRLAVVLVTVGDTLRLAFGRWGFLPGLLSTVGEVLALVLGVVVVVGGAGVLVALSARLGYRLRARMPDTTRRVVAAAVVAVGGAVWAALVGAVLDWLYFIDDPMKTLWIPAAVGAVIGLLVAVRALRGDSELHTGMIVYYIARTVFNALRSIEPLVMVIVFVIWVGFGEFAGSLALAVHTTAALAKLYSEQVESIQDGPLEAVRASGATRVQQVVYAVVPQIVPPYISFTMYRWDINVRMSTILGFAGGGGIGSILQQNLALGNYRAASVQMLAITIVVASMDWLSARFREALI